MFEEIISVENLLTAWREFLQGKRGKLDIQEFSLRLMDHIFSLNREFVNRSYRHGNYVSFVVTDPKRRDIHKASVRDRLLHHSVHRILYPYFDKKFIADSFSCQINKGTHKALNRFRQFSRTVSKNNTKQCWVLKCDIKKFFANIDHQILLRILKKHLRDPNILWLLREIVQSFHSFAPNVGLPLGNLTSQLFANVYMNEFDQFMKHTLRTRYYLRYADDFVIFSNTKPELESIIKPMQDFLRNELRLEIHKDKVFIQTVCSGIDFLGWVHFPDHRVLRTTTKKRMFRKITQHPTIETINSYYGLLKHGNAKKLEKRILEKSLP